MKQSKEKNLQKFGNLRTDEEYVRDQNLPQNSSKKSEKLQRIQLGIVKKPKRGNNLKEMRKNSWWVCSEIKQDGQNFGCNICGKGFKSARAVFGHMRSHGKRKAEKCGVNEGLMKRPETPRKKRSGRRYKIKTNSCNDSSWCNFNNSYSSLTVIDDELVDIAASLLKLSKGGFYSVDHVSDNESVKMETGLPVEFVNGGNGMNEHVAKQVSAVESGLEFDVLRSGCDSIEVNLKQFHGFDFGLSKNIPESFEYGADIKDGAIGVLLDGVLIDYWNPTVCAPATDGTKYEVVDVGHQMFDESNLRTCSPTNQVNIEYGPVFHNEQEFELFDAEIKDGTRRVLQAHKMVDYVIEGKWHENVGVADDKAFDKCDSGTTEPTTDNHCFQETQEHTCSICNRSFLSGKSLGGHRMHCQRLCRLETREHMKAGIRSDNTLGEKQGVKDGMKSGDNKKRRWKHQCLICCREFRSGQALGGHMRAHLYDKVQSNEAENVACDKGKDNLSGIEEGRKDENDAQDYKISGAVIEEQKHEKDTCNNEIQKMVIITQGNKLLTPDGLTV